MESLFMDHSTENQSISCPLSRGEMSRRNFLGWIIRGGFLITLAGMIFPAIEYLWPVMSKGPSVGLKEIARVDEISVWGAKKVILGGKALLLVRGQTEIKAFSAICTHLGCIVDWDGQKRKIVCPCHAGSFDFEGRVVSGPPPRPLPAYPVKVADGKIFVTL